jgi:tetratricopeptide (TPR) repeat protein
MSLEKPLENPSPKAWSPLYIGVIGFFCLLLPGFILLGKNYKKLGRPRLEMPTYAVGALVFLLFIGCILLLPENFDAVISIAVIVICLGIAAIQYPLYRRYLEEDENREVESLLKPALLSVLFTILVAISLFGYRWYEHQQLEKLLQQAQNQYETADYRSSLTTLEQIRNKFPDARLGYINASIAYEAMGKKDSALLFLNKWLEISPNDGEAKELLYKINYNSSTGSE